MNKVRLTLISINHTTAPVDVREKFSIPESEQYDFLNKLKDWFSIQEALVLNTCNRLEVYYTPSGEEISDKIIALLCSMRGIRNVVHQTRYFTILNDTKAVAGHLFRVAVGLESQVLGDIQIFSQVKKSYQQSVDASMAGVIIHRLLHTVFAAHKEVAHTTKFKDGAASVSYNASKLIGSEGLAETKDPILIIGAGQMGTDVFLNLTKLGFTNLSVTNRTTANAKHLIQKGATFIPFDQYRKELKSFKVVINTAYSPSLLITQDTITKRGFSAPAIVDLGTPRVVEEKVREIARLYNIDDISRLQQKTMGNREKAIPEVKAILAQYSTEFMDWGETMAFANSIRKFKETLDHLRKESIAKYLKKANEEQVDLIEEVSQSIVQRIVKLPVLQLKHVCQRDHAEHLNKTLNELFNLQYQTTEKS